MARPVALGFLAHSGWAAVVAVAGTPQDPEILDRRRIELFDPAIPADRFPFHAAQELPLAEARKLLARSEAATQKLARSALTDLLTELEEKDLLITACGIVGAPAKSSPPLPTILASHALIHAAEGERFRGVLVEAAEARALRVLRVPQRDLFQVAATRFRTPVATLQTDLAPLRRTLGPPWTADQKNSALIAWLALSTPES